MTKYINLIKQYHKEILFLSYQTVKTKYLETAFGLAWAIIKPMTFVVTFLFVFSVGLRSGAPQNGIPFVISLFAAYIPWFFISEAVTSGAGVLTANSTLVKTIKFPVMALPLINVLSLLYVHIILMLIVMVIYVILGGFSYLPNIHYLNLIYYWFTLVVFFTGITMVLSSLAVVVKDVKPLTSAIMQPLFWFTPIIYTPPSPRFDLLMRLVNPFYYFIIGYKETLLYRGNFWDNYWYLLYIWLIIGIIYFVAFKLWFKIRPLMADML